MELEAFGNLVYKSAHLDDSCPVSFFCCFPGNIVQEIVIFGKRRMHSQTFVVWDSFTIQDCIIKVFSVLVPFCVVAIENY